VMILAYFKSASSVAHYGFLITLILKLNCF
jgi:hypothetical protein